MVVTDRFNCSNILTWLLIVWQHSCQPTRSHVKQSFLTNMDFNLVVCSKHTKLILLINPWRHLHFGNALECLTFFINFPCPRIFKSTFLLWCNFEKVAFSCFVLNKQCTEFLWNVKFANKSVNGRMGRLYCWFVMSNWLFVLIIYKAITYPMSLLLPNRIEYLFGKHVHYLTRPEMVTWGIYGIYRFPLHLCSIVHTIRNTNVLDFHLLEPSCLMSIVI